MTKTVDEITIGNERVAMQLEDVALALVDLDDENPRIRYRLQRAKASGKAPMDLLLEEAPVKALRNDIRSNGGLRERIILRKSGRRYTVVEGNCRTACYQSLRQSDPENKLWHKIPARILPDEVGERKIATLLADMHVAGKIKWDAHEKAGQVYRMINELHMTYEEVASCMRVSKSTVARYNNAYSFMVDSFLAAYPEKGDNKWSFFDELFRAKELRERLKDDPDFGDKFCEWIATERLRQPVQVRALRDIVENATAYERFERGRIDVAFDDAKKVLEAHEPEHGSDFFKLLAKVRDNCTNAAQVKEILRIRTDQKARQRLIETYEALVDFMHLADVQPPSSDDREAA
jgi:hypothetical protein